MQVLRLVTVHPILTHFTIGALPVVIIAYAMAYTRRSPKWTFVGDATLVVTALITVATAGFGLVSNFVLDWPGGLGTWRWLHLGFGAATAALFLVFAAARVARRRRGEAASGGAALISAVGLALIVTFTGWIGGEVLVYRSGMAVTAAGDGALAPPVTGAGERAPADLEQAMHRLRGDWSAAQTELARMIVLEPEAEGFARIARHADEMARVADWIAEGQVPEHGEPEGEGEGVAFLPARRLYASVGGAEGQGGEESPLAPMAGRLADQARSMAEAARAEDMVQLSSSAGALSATCSACHEQLRWGEGHEH